MLFLESDWLLGVIIKKMKLLGYELMFNGFVIYWIFSIEKKNAQKKKIYNKFTSMKYCIIFYDIQNNWQFTSKSKVKCRM